MEMRSGKKTTFSAVKLCLALLFLLGAAMVFAGHKGKTMYSGAAAGAEGSLRAAYELSRDADKVLDQGIRPALDHLTDEERAAVSEMVSFMVSGTLTETLRKNEDTVMVPDTVKEMKMLFIRWQFTGPKLNATERKKITGLGEKEAEELRVELLRCIADETRELPAAARSRAGKLSGTERQAMLLQMFFTSCGTCVPELPDHVNQMKKSVRGKEQQEQAFRMIAAGEERGGFWFIAVRGNTVILLGVLFMLDAVMMAFMMAAGRQWAFEFKWVLILLIIDFLLVFEMLPLFHIVIRALFPEGTFSLSTLRRLGSYSLNLEAVKNTVIVSLATMVAGTVIAFPLAFLIGRTDLYGRKFFRSLFVITYMVPPYVGAMAWLRLMNPNVGEINLWLRRIFSLGGGPGPLNVYSLPGMIWVMTSFYFPYAFITLSRAMEKMDPTLEDASRISGASPLETVFRIDLPLMLPSLLAGALLVFVSAASCYGIPSIIGKPGNVSTVTTRIVEYTALGQQGLRDATALSVFLMATALLLLLLSDVVLAKRQYITVSGKSVTPTLVRLRSFRVPFTILVSLFAVVVIALPFATILLTSFKTDVGKSVLAAGNFTTANWSSVFARNETLHCLKNSLTYALIAASVGILISVVMNYLQQRTRLCGRSVPAFLISLGSGTPSVVIALGLIMTMRGNYGVNIYGTAHIMIIAYLVKYLMMGMRTVSSGMSQVHASLEESSQIAGAGWTRTMRQITGPLIFPSIAAGWFLIFIPSFYELSMTTLLYSGSTKTIGFQLYEYWTFTSQPMSCAMAVGILMLIAALNLVMAGITKGKFSI